MHTTFKYFFMSFNLHFLDFIIYFCFDDAFFQQKLGWSVKGSLGWTRIVGRLGCRLFELFGLR